MLCRHFTAASGREEGRRMLLLYSILEETRRIQNDDVMFDTDIKKGNGKGKRWEGVRGLYRLTQANLARLHCTKEL